MNQPHTRNSSPQQWGKKWDVMVLLLALLLTACAAAEELSSTSAAPERQSSIPAVTQTITRSAAPLRAERVLADVGLVTAMEFAPDGRLFFATKEGGVYTLDNIGQDTVSKKQILELEVAGGTESGLLGLALAPDFAQSRYFYLYYNVPNSAKEPVSSRIVRYTEKNNQAAGETIIVDDLPASPEQQYHFGGGLTMGPDGKLYLIFGDRNMTGAARDQQQLPGSILRYNRDGAIPSDNPFPGSPVYAYGIRNGFGLAFHPQTGQLYETENGASCDDELNLILPGADYGWGVHAWDACPYPDNVGQKPLHQWTPVVAPAGLIFYTGDLLPEFQGDLLVCGHNESKLFHLRLTRDGRALRQIQTVAVPGQVELCRIALTQGPDGWIYATTSSSLHRIGR